MGIKLVVPNGNFEGAGIGLIAPVSDGLQGLFLHNTNAPKAVKNWAPGKPNGIAVGGLVFTSGYGSFIGDSAYIDTQVSETHGMTALMAVRVTSAPSGAANVAVLLSNSNSPTENPIDAATGGTQISAFGTTTMRYRDQRFDGTSSVGDNNDLTGFYAVNSWGFMGFRNSDTNKNGRNFTTNVTGGAAEANIQNVASAKLRIGSVWNVPSANQGTLDIAMSMFYNRYLSDAEMVSMYNWAKAYLAPRGVAV